MSARSLSSARLALSLLVASMSMACARGGFDRDDPNAAGSGGAGSGQAGSDEQGGDGGAVSGQGGKAGAGAAGKGGAPGGAAGSAGSGEGGAAGSEAEGGAGQGGEGPAGQAGSGQSGGSLQGGSAGQAQGGTGEVGGTTGGTSAGTSAQGGAGTTSSGGTSAAGTNAGGTNAAGSNAGGTSAGGTSAGGTSAGGTSAGAGGSGGSGQGGSGGGTTTVTLRAMASGDSHTCARLVSGAVKCWGDNGYGQLGLGDISDRGDSKNEMGSALPAVDLGAGASVVQLVAGSRHTCALLEGGAVKCWGGNIYGQLGLGDSSDRGDNKGEMGDALPAVSLGGKAIALAAGGDHTCAVLATGTVKCWGDNLYGQLGLGDTSNRGDGKNEMGDNLPLADLGAGAKAVAVAAGSEFSCALLDSGAVKCWGQGYYGALGYGDGNDRGDGKNEMGDALPVVNLGSGARAVELVAGADHTCARLASGVMKCWGYNLYGQLGIGDDDNRGDGAGEMGDSLLVVSLGSGVQIAGPIVAGENHTCARLSDGSVKCWGRNLYGQLGLGDASDRGDEAGQMGDKLPVVNLGAGLKATMVTAGIHHTCVALVGGSVKCWGGGGDGQLGLGDLKDRGDGAGEMGDALPLTDLGELINP